jgi:type VI secretion system protein ImpM
MTLSRGVRGSQPAGYYGKLPARADFVNRRLARRTVQRWDNWLQQCLARSQSALGAAWEDCYLTAPAWRFALPARICGDSALIGVLVPSVDAVGRCFPLLLAQELPETTDATTIAAGASAWFEAAERLALEALDGAFDLATLDRPLPALSPSLPPMGQPLLGGAAASYPVGLWIGLPMLSALGAVLRTTAGVGPRPALWWTAGGEEFGPAVAISTGLVAPTGFAALLDGAWARHGWRGAPDPAPGDPEPAWDRDV